ncbi:MAG: PIN domain-containing protein [Planctomycetaceae bacterium]|nr:PIN domain-containing protein [Planctomycetaceae bacterium]
MVVLDTNTVLRCILQDNKEMAVLVDAQMSRDECWIPQEVVAEIVFVLLKVYRLYHRNIERSVSTILRHKNVRVPYKAVVETALRYFGETKLDFVDCLMV